MERVPFFEWYVSWEDDRCLLEILCQFIFRTKRGRNATNFSVTFKDLI